MTPLRLVVSFATGLCAVAGVLLACSEETTNTDSGNDSGTNDTGTTPNKDTGTTEPSDSGSDTGADTGPKDAGPDVLVDAAKPLIEKFMEDQAEAYCKSLSRCCFGDANLQNGQPVDGGGAFDSGTYDKAKCLAYTQKIGFEGSLYYVSDLSDAGGVGIDTAAAADCIAKVTALKCQLGRTEFLQIRDTCFGALQGLRVANGDCKSSLQCAPGHFCKGGKCEALRLADAGCGDFTTDIGVAEEACSWRGSGDTLRFCESYDQQGTELPVASWRCRPALPNGSACNNSAWCADGMCSLAAGPEYKCKDPVTYFPRDPQNCGDLVK
jgi:hypothetical protein